MIPLGRFCVARRCISAVAAPSDAPGARLNEIVTDGSWPRVVDRHRPDALAQRRHGLHRNERAGRRLHEQQRRAPTDPADTAAAARDHLVLVARRVDRRHLPRAVRVVERALDQVRRHAERRGARAIDRRRSPADCCSACRSSRLRTASTRFAASISFCAAGYSDVTSDACIVNWYWLFDWRPPI